MNQKPILFNGEMVRAILEGRKTQTRRIVKPQIKTAGTRMTVGKINCSDIRHWDGQFGVVFDLPFGRWIADDKPMLDFIKSPFGKPGDRLWVREAWKTEHRYDDLKPSHIVPGANLCWPADDSISVNHMGFAFGKKRPSIFMPRWASRITLEIKSVRVERLQEISEEDAKGEGVAPLFSPSEIRDPIYHPELDLKPMPYKNYLWHGHIGKTITEKQANSWGHQYSSYETAVGSFTSLWDSINANRKDKNGNPLPYAWDDNPWVWVVEFEKVWS
jgi:hypothetical protein